VADGRTLTKGGGKVNLSKGLESKKWSARSQASYRRETELRAQLFGVERRISLDQRLLDDIQKDMERQAEAATLGDIGAGGQIGEWLTRAQEQKGMIEVFRAQAIKIQARIDALSKPNPAEAKARAEHQAALAKLAIERLEIDQRLANVIGMAKGLLAKRAEMTLSMLGLMRKINFEIGFDGQDKDRFEALEHSLPGDLVSKSEAWVRWFLEEGQETERYTVLDETVIFAETLANPNVARRGEQINLTPAQFAEVSATEESRIAHPSEPIPGGGFRAGARVEIRNPRVEKCAESKK
jgi:hypothetical protein